MEPARFEFEFELTPEDVEHATRWMYTQGPGSSDYTGGLRTSGRPILILGLLGLGFSAAVGFQDLLNGTPMSSFTMFLFCLGLSWFLVCLFLFWLFFSGRGKRRLLEQNIRNLLKRESVQSLMGPSRVRVDDAGYYCDRPLGDSLRRWPGILGCTSTERFILITTLDLSALGIPRRAFRDGAHFDEFERAVQGWIARGGAGAVGSTGAAVRGGRGVTHED